MQTLQEAEEYGGRQGSESCEIVVAGGAHMSSRLAGVLYEGIQHMFWDCLFAHFGAFWRTVKQPLR